MQIQIEISSIDKVAADAVAVICFEAGEKTTEATTAVAPSQSSDPDIAGQGGWLAELRASGEFSGRLYEMSVLYRPQTLAAKRLVVIGGGKRQKFTSAEARRIGGALVRGLKSKGVKTIALLLEGAEACRPCRAGARGRHPWRVGARCAEDRPQKERNSCGAFHGRVARLCRAIA